MNIISVFLSNESQMGPLLFWTPLIYWMGKNSYIDQNIICCVPQEKSMERHEGA